MGMVLLLWEENGAVPNGSEPLQQDHGAATSRAEPQWSRRRGYRFRTARWRRSVCGGEQLAAQRQKGGATPMGKESEVPDAHQSRGQHVQKKAAQELFD